MQRNFRRGLLICLIPCVLAGIYAVRFDKYRLGIDLGGGTVLVYELNLEQTKKLRELEEQRSGKKAGSDTTSTGGLKSDQMLALASQIKKRIDPTDIKNVTVRPLGDNRIEIILPTGSSGVGGRKKLTEEDIEEVQRQVSQMGVLEFRILANDADDAEGIQATQQLIDGSDAAAALESAARQNLPPPVPDRTFAVRAAGDKAEEVRYAWAELSAEERETLGLSNRYATEPPRDKEGRTGTWLYPELARTRNRTFLYRYPASGDEDTGRSWSASMLLYSRPVSPDSPLAKKEREEQEKGITLERGPKLVEYYVLTRVSDADNLRVGGDYTVTATSDTDRKGDPSVSFRFNGAGARKFEQITRRNNKGKDGGTIRTLAIVLDGKVVSAPTLNAVISANGQITGRFDRKSVDRLVNFLRNGALSAQLKEQPTSESTIASTLGADTIRKGKLAIGLSFAAILVFMIIYYEFAGFVASVALLANLVLTLGFMVGVNAAFTLPGLAGLVLMLGMAVDANVLIYERLREERDKGANLATAIRNGYDRAFGTIIDTHLTSIFTAIVLYTFGNDQLKGFAITLTVGLVISLFTSLYMTRLMFDFWLHKRWLTELRMRRFFSRPSFNPMKFRFVFFPLTGVLTVIGLGLFLYRGESILNVDFRGGTVYAAQLREGDERGLITTTAPDGKSIPGFRELLGEERQKERLGVSKVSWINEPPAGSDIAALNFFDFDITYADGDKQTITLNQKPDGNTREEMEASVKARAETLPDVSIEQMFLAGDPPFETGKSRSFTIRTTERSPELVQVSIDRLLRDDKNQPLVPIGQMSFGAITGPQVLLTFDRETSRNQVQYFLMREFRRAGADNGTATFELMTPDGKSRLDAGRYREMLLNLSNNPQLGSHLARLALTAVDRPAAAVIGVAAATAQEEAIRGDVGVKSAIETVEKALQGAQVAIKGRPDPIRLEVFDSQLASETRTKAFYAIVASWIAILLYLWFRFGNWTFGLAAVLCLVHDLCFTLGAIAVAHYLYDTLIGHTVGLQDYKIDLAAVAALLTLVGYSVNEIIVNFARIREVRGKNPFLTPQMINDSVNQTLSRTILTSMTVFLVSMVLYVFGGEGIHLFAFVMVMGVMISTYSSIFVASPLLLFLGEGRHGADGAPAPPTEEAPRPDEETPVVEG